LDVRGGPGVNDSTGLSYSGVTTAR
jgi:hypothetical protein